jgi:hypothetical protein
MFVSMIRGSARAARTGVRCGAATAVTDVEFAFLLGLQRRVDPPLRRVRCELAAQHGDSHVAFTMAADGGDCWWWVRWDTRRQNLVPLLTCDELARPGGDECMLPRPHPGLHSYEM